STGRMRVKRFFTPGMPKALKACSALAEMFTPASSLPLHAWYTTVLPPKYGLSWNSSQQLAGQPVKLHHAPVMVFITYCCWLPAPSGTFRMIMFSLGNCSSCQPKLPLYCEITSDTAYWILSVMDTRGSSRDDCKAADMGYTPSWQMIRLSPRNFMKQRVPMGEPICHRPMSLMPLGEAGSESWYTATSPLLVIHTA